MAREKAVTAAGRAGSPLGGGLSLSLSLSLVTNPLPSLASGNGQLLRWCWPLGEQHQHFAGAAAEGRTQKGFPLSLSLSRSRRLHLLTHGALVANKIHRRDSGRTPSLQGFSQMHQFVSLPWGRQIMKTYCPIKIMWNL